MKLSIFLVLLFSKLVFSFQINSVNNNDGTKSQAVPEQQPRAKQNNHGTIGKHIIKPVLLSSQLENNDALVSAGSIARHVFQTVLHTQTVTGINHVQNSKFTQPSKIINDNPKTAATSLAAVDATVDNEDYTKILVQSSHGIEHIQEESIHKEEQNKNEDIPNVSHTNINKGTPIKSRSFEKNKHEDSQIINSPIVYNRNEDNPFKSLPFQENDTEDSSIISHKNINVDTPIKSRSFEENKHEDSQIIGSPFVYNRNEDDPIKSHPFQENKTTEDSPIIISHKNINEDSQIKSRPFEENKHDDSTIISSQVEEKINEDTTTKFCPFEHHKVEDVPIKIASIFEENKNEGNSIKNRSLESKTLSKFPDSIIIAHSELVNSREAKVIIGSENVENNSTEPVLLNNKNEVQSMTPNNIVSSQPLQSSLGNYDLTQESTKLTEQLMPENTAGDHLNLETSVISKDHVINLDKEQKINSSKNIQELSPHNYEPLKYEIGIESDLNTSVSFVLKNDIATEIHVNKSEPILHDSHSITKLNVNLSHPLPVLERNNSFEQIQNISKPLVRVNYNETGENRVETERTTQSINHEVLSFDEAAGEHHDTPELTIIESITVRKCCKSNQFFSTNLVACTEEENIPFIDHAHVLMYGFHANAIELDQGLLKTCPYTNELPIVVADVTNSNFILLPTGEIYDFFSEISFNSSEYCLELLGENVQTSLLNLVFCPNASPQDYVQYSDYELDLNNTSDHSVRKCCEENQYYDVIHHECLHLNGSDYFNSEIQAMTFSKNPVELTYMTGSLKQCPNADVPTISPVTLNMIRLKSTGEIIHVPTGIHYNVTNYCLELIGSEESDLSLTVALCPESFMVPKCCPFGEYFDESQLKCIYHQQQDPIEENTLLNYIRKDIENYNLAPLISFITCDRSFPIEESAEKLILHDGLLCNHASCFDRHDYCVEFIGNRNNEFKPSAFYCEPKIFIKCCPENQILGNQGCIDYEGGNSVLLTQLMNTRSFRRAFDSKRCNRGPGIPLDETYADYIKWWASEDGNYLNVKSESEHLKIEHYCIDDFIDSEQLITPGALVCDEEVSHMIPNDQNFSHYLERGSLGKCCPQNTKEGYVQYLAPETNKCEFLPNNQSLSQNALLNIANLTEEHFHDFPQCSSGNLFYHSYTFKPGREDYVRMTERRTIELVSKVGRCISNERVVRNRDMCVEYVLNEDGQIYPTAFMCEYTTIANVYTEKYILVTMLLGISCFFLTATLICLFTMRVRRGMVTVRKVNTLAGRILVSFVSSQLIGIIAFILTQHDNSLIDARSDTISCYVLAGFIEYFNLAAFCWNTSICLESLLLTIHISMASEGIKYILHSLWAWGFPLFMTVLMFLMDYYQDQLPCWVVTPQLGINNCFFPKADHRPLLLYFYLPIFITLIANVFFLVGAKLMRKARLLRLENGRKKVFSEPTGRPSSDSNQSRTGGMRTHQNQNTKAESIRIVIWTGGVWFLECLGYVVTRFLLDVATEERWYDYLWYIPTCLNSLRGVGIFVIIVLTPDKRKEISISFGRLRRRIFSKFDKPYSGTRKGNKTSMSTDFSSKRFSYNNGNDKRRNMSVTTVISTLSSSINMGTKFEDDNRGNLRKSSIASYISSKIDTIRKKSSVGGGDNLNNKLSMNNNRPKRKIGMIRSVSQFDRRMSTASYTGSFLEELEMKEDSVRRKYSMNPSSVQLPKLQEEDSSYDEDSRQRYFREETSFNPARDENSHESPQLSLNEPENNHTENNMPSISEDCREEPTQKPENFTLNQITNLNDKSSLPGEPENTLTELDIDLEPLELDIPIRFPFRISSSEISESGRPNLKSFSATSWTDIDLQLPDDDEDNSPIDV